MKLLVVGANGQVGSELRLLHTVGCHIVGLARHELDIRSDVQVATAIAAHKPNFVVNAAAYTAVDKAEEEFEQAYAVNRDGPQNLARA